MKKMKSHKRHTATKATSTPPIGMPGLSGHVYDPDVPNVIRPSPGNISINPDAKMPGNVTGPFSKPVYGSKMSKSKGKKRMDY